MTDAEPSERSASRDLDAIDAALGLLRGRGPGMRGRGAGGDSGDPAAADHAHDRFGPHGGRRSHPRGGGQGADRGFGPPEGWAGMRGGGPAMRHGGPARLRLIEALHAASHPLSVSELGEAIGVDQPRASRLVQQGVEMGLVQREADPDDARRTRIALTETGERFARGFRGRRREYLTQALTDFTGEERAELARLLTKLAAAWPAD